MLGVHSWKAPINKLIAKAGYRIVRRNIDLLDILRLRNVDLVIDVGANEGQFAAFLRRKGYYGRIASFEPIPAVCARLKQLHLNDPNWAVYELALGDYDGPGKLNIAKSSQLSSLLPPTRSNQKRERDVIPIRSEDITVQRLDTIFPSLRATRPFLKLDVQGAEELVLRGAKETLLKVVGVQLEIALYQFYETQLLLGDVLRLMDDLGFMLAVMDPIGYYDPADPCHLMEMDCVFVRKASDDFRVGV